MTAGPDLQSLLDAQRSAFFSEELATPRVRRDRLTRAIDLLVSHEAELCDIIAQDFGQRPANLTRFMDIFPAVHALKFARRHHTYDAQWLFFRGSRRRRTSGLRGCASCSTSLITTASA